MRDRPMAGRCPAASREDREEYPGVPTPATPRTPSQARVPGLRRRARRRPTGRRAGRVGPGPLAGGARTARPDGRRLGPPRPPRHRPRPGVLHRRLGPRLAARRTRVRRRRRAARPGPGPAHPGGQGETRACPRRLPYGVGEAAQRSDAMARTAPAGAHPRHRRRCRPALRRGPPPARRPPPRPPSDGRPARRTPGHRRPRPAARGLRLRLLGRRTGPRRLPLAILPVVAHAERYRVLAAAGLEPPIRPPPGTGPAAGPGRS